MRPKRKLEPIFSRQEQGVVYLFSRYWERIPAFKSKNILRIHTRFPDFSIVNEGGTEEAIEFEYGLSSFRSHLAGRALKNLYRDGGIRRLYIVYWEGNDDEDDLRAKIRQKARFDVVFVCLKDWFQAEVRKIPRAAALKTFWRFIDNKQASNQKAAYPLREAVVAAKQLGRSVEALAPRNGLYRATGFNTGNSAFIECGHWAKIHFYTTTRLGRERIPRKLFTKPTGCKYFNGYFDIKAAFEITKSSELVKQFWAKYYFYEYEHGYSDSTCFVCNFKPLEYERGRQMYDYLHGKGYSLGTRSSILIEDAGDMLKIDSIVAGQGGARRQDRRHRDR